MKFVALALLLLLVSTSGSALAVSDSVSVAIVDVPRPQTKWGYAPGTRRVAPGTWVTWSNDGQDAHTVTALDGSFDSGDLDPSEGFSWYFDQPGTIQYVCALDPWMTGTIVITGGDQPAAVSDQPPTSADTPPEVPETPPGE